MHKPSRVTFPVLLGELTQHVVLTTTTADETGKKPTGEEEAMIKGDTGKRENGNNETIKQLKRGKEKWQVPVGLGYQRTATHQTLLIVTKRGNVHHYTGYQQTDQYCSGRKNRAASW